MYYNLQDLQAAYLRGEHLRFLFFWGHTASKDGSINEGCFSQWWKSHFEVDGITYSCAEQYMMAQKARMFEDEEMLKSIMNTDNPKSMKAFGRAVRDFDKETWDNCCYELVKKGNLAKFSQNPELLEYLKSTHRRILVEASPRDRIWGIGMGKQNPDAECPIKWKGTNLLGFALTEAREELLSMELPSYELPLKETHSKESNSMV